MQSTEELERAPQIVGTGAATPIIGVSPRARLRARVCPALLLSSDIIAFAIASCLAFLLDAAPTLPPYTRAIANLTSLGAGWHGWGTLLVFVCLLGFLGSRGHYTTRMPVWARLSDVALAIPVALAADIFLTIAIYQRPVEVEGLLRWILFCPCLLLLRAGSRQALRAMGLWVLRTLIIAAPDEIAVAEAALTSDHTLGYDLIGTTTPMAAAKLRDDELLRMVADRGADMVVIAVGCDAPEAERTVLAAFRRTNLPIALVPSLRGLPVVGFRQHYFLGHDMVMLVSSSNLVRPLSRVLKTSFDQIAAVALLILLAPLLLALAALVRADGGPAFYYHRRIGLGGRVFNCIKFRSMVMNADRVLHELLDASPAAAAEWAATQKLRHDPRITRIGNFLRQSSLDEIPQLFNVLLGEMSLVGPRPIVAAEVSRYGSDIEHYYAAKPGLTGLWQVSGRSDMSYARRVQLDVWYVRNWTLWHDIAILLKTIPAVFLRRGAR